MPKTPYLRLKKLSDVEPAPVVRNVPLSDREIESVITALSYFAKMTSLEGHRLGENEALRQKLREYRDGKAVVS